MAANEAVGALLDELVALTCKHDSPPRSPPRTPPRIPNSFDANGSPVVRSSETRRVPAAPRRSTCEPTEEPTEEPTGFAQLPRCVLILLAKDYLTASQRAALAASDKYAREELVTNGRCGASHTSRKPTPSESRRGTARHTGQALRLRRNCRRTTRRHPGNALGQALRLWRQRHWTGGALRLRREA